MAKSYAKRNAEQVRVASLLAAAARREVEQPKDEDGMTLDEAFQARRRALYLAAKSGHINQAEWEEKTAALLVEFKAKKGRAAR